MQVKTDSVASFFIDYTDTHKIAYAHMHALDEIIFVLCGDATVITENIHRRCENSFLMYCPRTVLHEQINDTEKSYKRYCIKFDSTKVPFFTFPKSPFLFELTQEELAPLTLWTSQLLELYQSKEVSPYTDSKRDLLLGLLCNEMFELLRNKGDALFENPPPYLTKVYTYIAENLSDKIRLDDIASAFFVSRKKLTRDFKKYNNVSVMEYITTVRIEKSKKELLAGESLENIAANAGFQSVNYYIKVFSKLIGVSPNHYRRIMWGMQSK